MLSGLELCLTMIVLATFVMMINAYVNIMEVLNEVKEVKLNEAKHRQNTERR